MVFFQKLSKVGICWIFPRFAQQTIYNRIYNFFTSFRS